MFIFKLKSEFKNKLYWNNPKYKLVNFENILKCFEFFDNKFYNLNWTDQRHFWLNLNNPDNIITTNKYFLIAPVSSPNEILKNKYIDWKIVYVNSYTYLNQQKTLLKVNFEVDNFFDLLKFSTDKLEISGLLSRTTLPKYTYSRIIKDNKEQLVISPNVLLNEDLNVSPFVLTKIQELFRYNKENLKDLYFYNDTNAIVLKNKHVSDIKNNIIRKPLFISNEYSQEWNKEHVPFIDDLFFNINTKINLDRLNTFETKTIKALKQKFQNEHFFIILPVPYKKGAKSFYLDLDSPYSIFYPNTFIYKNFEDGKRAEDIVFIDEDRGVEITRQPGLKGSYGEIYRSRTSYFETLFKTSRCFVITFDNVFLVYEDSIVDYNTYKSVGSILKNNIEFETDKNGISQYLNLSQNSTDPVILDNIYFDHPEKKVKGGFLNASTNEINQLFKHLFVYYYDQSGLDLQNLFNEYIPQWKAIFNTSHELINEFFSILKTKIQKQTIDFKDIIKFTKNVQHDWKKYISVQQTSHTNSFNPNLNYKLDPKLLFNKQFTNYLIISPNTRQEIDLDLYFTQTRTIEINNPVLFNYHYSENEFYDSGYSLLSYPFYNKNFVNKYLKNDTILSNAHVEYLKTNVNSINFQKQQESIQLARAYQDRSLSWLNGGINILSLGLINQNSISANILAQSAFQNTTSILSNTIAANRGIENSKMAITKFYATQNDQYLQNKIDQNILGIESLLELKEEAASLYKQTLNSSELEKANKFLNKWGWKVNEYITEIAFNSTNFINNTNLKFDYIELEDIDFLPYLTNDENIYLQDVFKIGVWLIYDLKFEPKTFFEPKSPFLQVENST